MVTPNEQEDGASSGADASAADPPATSVPSPRPDDQPATSVPSPRPEDFVLQRTRTASLFVAAAVGLILALLMLVFVLQNGDRQSLEFLWFDFTLPAGAAMLLAAIVGGLIVALLGLGRVVQLRLAARRHRQADRRLSV